MSCQQKNIVQKRDFGQFTSGRHKPMMAMVEVTNRCNMSCPICYSDSNQLSKDVPIDKIRLYLERLLKLTETPIPIQISGGEPSIRDDLPEIIALAKQIGYRNIELITNGIRISNEPDFLDAMKLKGLTAVYLQFDGLNKETTLRIRGRDMSETRHRAVSAIRDSRLCCTLAVVVTRGINEGDIGDVVRYGVENIDVVRAINFQSAARFTGRFGINDHYKGYGMQDLLKLIEAETGISGDTFRSEHIGHACCNAMSPIFIVNGKLEPLFKYISKEDSLAFLGKEPRNKILATFAGKKEFFFRHLLNPNAWRLITKAAPIFGSNPYNVLRTDHLLLFAKSFMETDTLDPQRIDQCCYAITGEKGIFSFCAYNNLHRFSNESISK
jgi:uncharacterized radical SAM superfamily Fe-S cluster-containing enzyme